MLLQFSGFGFVLKVHAALFFLVYNFLCISVSSLPPPHTALQFSPKADSSFWVLFQYLFSFITAITVWAGVSKQFSKVIKRYPSIRITLHLYSNFHRVPPPLITKWIKKKKKKFILNGNYTILTAPYFLENITGWYLWNTSSIKTACQNWKAWVEHEQIWSCPECWMLTCSMKKLLADRLVLFICRKERLGQKRKEILRSLSQ